MTTGALVASKIRADQWLLAGLAVTVLALVLRTTGLGVGLPYHYHWDEPTVMNRVIRMGGGDLNPHFFYYPTLLMYMLLAVQGCMYVVGRALHQFPSVTAFAVTYLTDSTLSYMAGRALVAGLGAASVLVTFVVGRRFLSAPAAIVGALLLAVSPIHIGSSHFITNDVPMAFFALVAYVFLWDVYSKGRGRDYVLSGLRSDWVPPLRAVYSRTFGVCVACPQGDGVPGLGTPATVWYEVPELGRYGLCEDHDMAWLGEAIQRRAS